MFARNPRGRRPRRAAPHSDARGRRRARARGRDTPGDRGATSATIARRVAARARGAATRANDDDDDDDDGARDDRSNAGRWIIEPRRAREAKAGERRAMNDARGGCATRASEREGRRGRADDGEGRDDGSNAEAVVDRRKYLDAERRKREGNDRDDVTDDARARDARFYRSVRLMR